MPFAIIVLGIILAVLIVAAFGDAGFDAQPMQQITQGLAVESFVGDDGRRLLLGASHLATNCGYVHHQRQ